MLSSEMKRLLLHERLLELLGDERARTLMENLPPINWDDFATKADLAVLKADLAVLKTDLAVLKTDLAVLKTDLAVLKTDMDVRFAQVDVRFAQVDGRFDKMDGRFDKMDGRFAELRGEAKRDLARQTYVVLFAMAAAVAPIWVDLLTRGAG